MVAWKNLFPDFSGPVGGVVAYTRVATTNPSLPKRALLDQLTGVRLSSGGVVDTNAPMRGQYMLGGFLGPAFTGSAGFSYDADDVNVMALALVPYMTATMFVAPASAVPASPSPDQIRLAAVQVIRGTGYAGSPNYRTAAGNSDYIFVGPATALPPNTKYWVAVMPTSLADPGSAPSIANDVPMYGANTHGRAVSVWSNRTPLAPVITEPVGQTTVFPGTYLKVKFSPKDPDRVQSYPGDSGVPDFEDMAGAQIQYRHRATDDLPATAWADLPIKNLSGVSPGPGWWIDDVAGRSETEGGYYLWRNRGLTIECGITAGNLANGAFLPAGDWELRVRTFDYGHGRPDSANAFNPSSPGNPPLNDTTRTYTPDTYPAVNTSPWSTPVRVFVNPQVPEPQPISPRDNIAVIYPVDPVVTTIDTCDNATGWTGSIDGVPDTPSTFWFAGSVGIATFSNPDGDADTLKVKRPGAIDVSTNKYLTLAVRVFSSNRNLIVRSGSRSFPIIGSRELTDAFFEYTVQTDGEPITELEFEHTRAAGEPWAGLLVGNIATTNAPPVTLSWQYRNTFSPPYAQQTRTVQIRKATEDVWTTLVNAEASASASLMVPRSVYQFVSGNQYAWRVAVTDASGMGSGYSPAAYFWVVPAPSSGEVIPTPSDTIDEATLGCGTHRVEVYRRGGKVRAGEITGFASVEWNRNRDDISIAKVIIKEWGVDCGNLLSILEPWAYELVITRDNGYTKDRVWEGPITLLTYENDQVVVQAKDVMAYAYRRIIKQSMGDSGKSPTAGRTVVQRATAVLQNVFAPDDPNVLAYLNPMQRNDDAKQYRTLPAYSRTGFEEVDDMAANAGLDYTAVGRSILLWGTKHRIGTLPEFTDRDLGNSPIVSVYGMSMANVYAVSDGNGIYGEATRLDENGHDEKYGLVEMLSSTWASESAAESGTYTEEGLNTVRESFATSAERSIADRYPPPVVVRVPDNTRLHPDVVLSIQHLVPGVVIPLRSTGTLRTVVASQKLDAVKVIETAGEETITITLSPFSRDDNDIAEEEG